MQFGIGREYANVLICLEQWAHELGAGYNPNIDPNIRTRTIWSGLPANGDGTRFFLHPDKRIERRINERVTANATGTGRSISSRIGFTLAMEYSTSCLNRGQRMFELSERGIELANRSR